MAAKSGMENMEKILESLSPNERKILPHLEEKDIKDADIVVISYGISDLCKMLVAQLSDLLNT